MRLKTVLYHQKPTRQNTLFYHEIETGYATDIRPYGNLNRNVEPLFSVEAVCATTEPIRQPGPGLPTPKPPMLPT